ncbi:hypothetical protein SLH49_00275 [Cognatiyoonia sp. IB215446]|uniref:hypothetical protein n=1 Tax=Cognatiyoonia sp. IB215446 TaxID=3097355 RepID=UPI002A0E841C|nr:hypothetical protein [Cognatiyoonia sp. IB215446]MDX8346410.1 hypothetical protein [Cognatiyoonia sp. IB215446]
MRYLVFLITLIFPIQATSQQVNLQTGEHDGFTRVVVSIPTGSDWRLGRNAEGYLLQVSGVDGYDLSRFFDLIPRTRIRDAQIGTQPDQLQLFVDCLCFVDAFIDRVDILVVDLKSGRAPKDAAFETPFVPADLPVPVDATPDQYRVSANGILPIVFPPPPQLENPLSVSALSDANAVETTRPPQPSGDVQITINGADQDQSKLSEEQSADLEALAQSITESLARGLSQGALLPNLDLQGGLGIDAEAGDLAPPGIETRSGIDLAAIPSDPRIVRTQDGQICPPAAFFDVSGWAKDLPFFEQLGKLRGDFVGEFDRYDEESILAKARLFIHFGFGREAIQTLSLDGAMSQERRFLIALAHIIDEDPPSPGVFDGLVSCRANVALWALLATAEGGLDGQVDVSSVLRAFKALPLHLQSHLGPRLSERFLAIGDESSALQSLAQAVSEPEPEVDAQLAEAALLEEIGETEEANANLAALARVENRTTPAAMAAFLRAAVRNDISVTDQDFALADVLRFENAASSDINDLQLAQMNAYLHQDAFDAAARLREELRSTAGSSVFQMVEDAFALTLTERGEDGRFLNFAFDDMLEAPVAATQLAVSERLLDLGFPERAAEILVGIASEQVGAQRGYLQAEIALMRGDAATALKEIDGIESERAAWLRGAAESVARGELFDRTRLGIQTDGSGPWRVEDWAEISASDDPLLRDVSDLVRSRSATILSESTPIASGRALLEKSVQSRDVMERLLDRFSGPPTF